MQNCLKQNSESYNFTQSYTSLDTQFMHGVVAPIFGI